MGWAQGETGYGEKRAENTKTEECEYLQPLFMSLAEKIMMEFMAVAKI